MSRRALICFCALALLCAGPARAAEPVITVASTTSTENSGLFAHILPLFTRDTGIAVRVVAVGTGQAIRIARNGDADVLLVHHKPSEEKFVAEGYGVKRHQVMSNDFVLAGPTADPAGVRGLSDAAAALRMIAQTDSVFASRGDASGTHKKELSLWRAAGAAGLDPARAKAGWYRETGSGMGATLNTASAMDAYVLSDRGTWAAFANKGDLEILVHGDPRLRNPYGVILVNPARHPHVNARAGQAFIDWLISDAGQSAIDSFRVDGEQLFFPDAK